MARWYCVMLLLALLVVHTSARDVPSKEVVDTSTKQGPSSAGLKDEKNFITYGGIGGFAGVGGIGGAAGVGTIGGIGGASGIGGVGGGLGGIGGVGAGAVAGGIFP